MKTDYCVLRHASPVRYDVSRAGERLCMCVASLTLICAYANDDEYALYAEILVFIK